MADGGAFDEAVAAFAAAVDGLLALDVVGAPATSLTALVSAIEVQRNRLAAVDQRVLAAVASSGAVISAGATSLPDLLTRLTRCSRGVANARAARAIDLGPRRALTGETLDPIHPITAAAVADGRVNEEQSRVIVSVLGRLGPQAPEHAFAAVEHFLVDAARHQGPAGLVESGRWALARLDPSELEAAEATVDRTRNFSLVDPADPADGVAARGRLTAELAAALRAVLDPLAAPRSANETGERDARTAGQRYHDALLEVVLRVLRSGTLPESGGVAASVVVQLTASSDHTAADAEAPGMGPHEPGSVPRRFARTTRLGDAGAVTFERLRPFIDECEITTVILTSTGGVLSYGQQRRVATAAMRRALAARDGGCCFPGCDRPPAWCEAHHVWAWIEGGPTALSNLCLLCAHHHRSFAAAGWRVEMCDGVPVWTPPPWLDRRQRTVRNTTRHLPVLEFPVITERELVATLRR